MAKGLRNEVGVEVTTGGGAKLKLWLGLGCSQWLVNNTSWVAVALPFCGLCIVPRDVAALLFLLLQLIKTN